MGVGNGSQACHYDCALPVAMRPRDHPDRPVRGNINVPAVTNSDLPGLLGLEALRENRAVLDFTTNRLYFCGPGNINIERAVPPGTETFQLEVAPSGHIVLPCCEFAGNGGDMTRASLTLHTRPVSDPPTHPPSLPADISTSQEPPTPAPLYMAGDAAQRSRL